MTRAFKIAVSELIQSAVDKHGYERPFGVDITYTKCRQFYEFKDGKSYIIDRLPEQYVEKHVSTFVFLKLLFDLAWDKEKDRWKILVKKDHKPLFFRQFLIANPKRYPTSWQNESSRNAGALYASFNEMSQKQLRDEWKNCESHSIPRTAGIIGVSTKTIKRRIEDGKLLTTNKDDKRVTTESILEYLFPKAD